MKFLNYTQTEEVKSKKLRVMSIVHNASVRRSIQSRRTAEQQTAGDGEISGYFRKTEVFALGSKYFNGRTEVLGLEVSFYH